MVFLIIDKIVPLECTENAAALVYVAFQSCLHNMFCLSSLITMELKLKNT